MKRFTRLTALLLVLCSVFSLIACQGQEEASPVNADALFQVLLEQVKFDTELADAGADAAMYFSELPEGAQVKMYVGSGYYADKLVQITVKTEADRAAARKSVDTHLEELRNQFQSYIPEEVSKIDKAVIWEQGVNVILCVTGDVDNAKSIVENAAEKTAGVTVTEGTTQGTTGATTEATTEVTTEATTEATTQPTTEATTPPTTQPEKETDPPATTTPPTPGKSGLIDLWTGEYDANGYPVLHSQNGEYHSYGNGACRVDNIAYETYKYDENAATNYAAAINKVANALAGTTNVYCLPIPTSIGIVFPDDVAATLDSWQDQGERMQRVIAKLNDNVKVVNCYDNLMRHRNEYLYFKTDFHWNGKAAYYAYEIWCQEKGISPYTLSQRKLKTFDNFWGALYQNNANKDTKLNSEDIVEAYYPYFSNIDMTYTDKKGNKVDWSIIADVSGWAAYSKYLTFAGGDNPITEYRNPNVTDGSVGIVVKESFGNALMPYLADHYSVLYEIDYRYWEGDLIAFAKEVGATDMTFANNMGMIRASALVGMLADNIK